MSQKKVDNYGLYQTLYSPSFSEEQLPDENKKELLEKVKIMNYDQEKALFMLIYEHARLNGDVEYDSENIILPYSIEQKGKNISIKFPELPNNLMWILWKFSNIVQKE